MKRKYNIAFDFDSTLAFYKETLYTKARNELLDDPKCSEDIKKTYKSKGW